MQYTDNFHLAKPEGTDKVDISVLNGNMDIIDENMVKTYMFDFDVTFDGEVYTATPREGVTYEAMIDALEETPNVYFRIYFAQLSEVLYIRADDVTSQSLRGSTLLYMDLNPSGSAVMRFVAARIGFYDSNNAYIVLQPLANYTP